MKKLDIGPLDVSKPLGPKRRLLRLASLIQKQLSDIISRETELPRGSLLTISAVEVLSDYSAVKVGLTVWPIERQEEVMLIAEKSIKTWQKLLSAKLTMYRVPHLRIYLDQSSSRAAHLEQLLDNLQQ